MMTLDQIMVNMVQTVLLDYCYAMEGPSGKKTATSQNRTMEIKKEPQKCGSKV